MSRERGKSLMSKVGAGLRGLLRGFLQLSYRSSRAWTAFLS